MLSQLLTLDRVEVGIELLVDLGLLSWATAVISRFLHLRVLRHDCFRRERAILDFHAHLLLLSVFHALVPACAVLMQPLKEVLHVLIAAALHVYLGFEGALLLFLHFLEDSGGLQVHLLVAMGQLLQGLVVLGPLGCRLFGGMGICRPRG